MNFFDIFQLVMLVFFLLVFLGRALFLWVRQGINPFTVGAGKKGWARFFELAVLPWLAVWIVAILLAALHLPFLPASWNPLLVDNLPLKVTGVLMVVLGNFVFVWALASFGSSWRVGIDTRKAGDLVTNGAFAFSRNPIYVFLDLYFIGTFLLNGTLFFLLFAVVTPLGIHYQILQEENFLADQYGQAYRHYYARTGRYFPLK